MVDFFDALRYVNVALVAYFLAQCFRPTAVPWVAYTACRDAIPAAGVDGSHGRYSVGDRRIPGVECAGGYARPGSHYRPRMDSDRDHSPAPPPTTQTARKEQEGKAP